MAKTAIRNTHLRNRFQTTTAAAAAKTHGTHNRISAQTVRNRSDKSGLSACRPYVGYVLTRRHRINHSQLSRTRLIGTLAYQEIDEKIDVNRKSSGISGVWRTSTVCNR